MKNEAPRDELKSDRGRGWAVPYRWATSPPLQIVAVKNYSIFANFGR